MKNEKVIAVIKNNNLKFKKGIKKRVRGYLKREYRTNSIVPVIHFKIIKKIPKGAVLYQIDIKK